MSYQRVIPRDLFNEAKLLKCLGRLYIEAERQPTGKITIEHTGSQEFRHIFPKAFEGFLIRQNPGSADLFCANILVRLDDRPVHIFSPYNSKDEYPIYVQDVEYKLEPEKVFTAHGTLTQEFLNYFK